jgi:UDP-N-acetylmuramoyl-tripeptide--D-alanyl-D-alanine ligase
MRIPVAEAARATNARVIGDASMNCLGVSYDSRSLVPGNLFVAVVAARDGHDFVSDAVRAGCSAVLVSREVPGCAVPQIVVSDTATGLTDLGRWARAVLAARVDGRVVGITGSVGKTTTKDYIASALRTRFSVGASDKSLNNDQGMPVTLLNAPDDAEALVLEMGMRGFGEIARLAALARPDIGVVTRVGESHGERVGGIDGVARAKGELIEALPSSGIAVLNGDDPRVAAMGVLTDAPSVTYGFADIADLRVVDVDQRGTGGVAFRFVSRWGSGECVLPTPGMHMVSNAAAALLVAAVAGCDLDRVAEALGRTELSPMRMAIHRAGGLTIIDDSYNASPTSVVAALDTMAAMPAGRRVAVLGLMAEIADSGAMHRAVAEHASRLGIEVVAVETDLYGTQRIDNHDDVAAFVRALPVDSTVLFKASRVVGLDHVVRLVLG